MLETNLRGRRWRQIGPVTLALELLTGHFLLPANRAVLRPDLPAHLVAQPVQQGQAGSQAVGLVLQD